MFPVYEPTSTLLTDGFYSETVQMYLVRMLGFGTT